MWPKSYKDYEQDKPLVKEKVAPGKGIIGCEMHELNGWGNTLHHKENKKKKPGFFRTLIYSIFGK